MSSNPPLTCSDVPRKAVTHPPSVEMTSGNDGYGGIMGLRGSRVGLPAVPITNLLLINHLRLPPRTFPLMESIVDSEAEEAEIEVS